MARVFICTVGGSHQPIVRALDHHQPELAIFVCSERDPATGRAGSRGQVDGEGLVCSSVPNAPPDLPNIPAQAGLLPDRVQILEVPADDPVVAIDRIRPVVAEQVARVGRGQVAADYTGGTKGMTAALFFAAVHTPGVTLHNVTGPRGNLVKVADGTERVRELRNAHRLLLPVRLAEVERAWERFAYGEAARMLEALTEVDEPVADRLVTASRGYDAWSQGRHNDAMELLRVVARFVPRGHLTALAKLLEPRNKVSDAWRIHDQLLGARRDAAVSRYDTAILSSYRTFEAIGQWTLYWHHDISTDDAPAALPELDGLTVPGHDGKAKLGQHAAWTATERLGGPLAAVGRATSRSRLRFAALRNQSRFAHGTLPIDRGTYQQASRFIEAEVWPTFLAVAFGGTEPFEQLPQTTESFKV